MRRSARKGPVRKVQAQHEQGRGGKPNGVQADRRWQHRPEPGDGRREASQRVSAVNAMARVVGKTPQGRARRGEGPERKLQDRKRAEAQDRQQGEIPRHGSGGANRQGGAKPRSRSAEVAWPPLLQARRKRARATERRGIEPKGATPELSSMEGIFGNPKRGAWRRGTPTQTRQCRPGSAGKGGAEGHEGAVQSNVSLTARPRQWSSGNPGNADFAGGSELATARNATAGTDPEVVEESGKPTSRNQALVLPPRGWSNGGPPSELPWRRREGARSVLARAGENLEDRANPRPGGHASNEATWPLPSGSGRRAERRLRHQVSREERHDGEEAELPRATSGARPGSRWLPCRQGRRPALTGRALGNEVNRGCGAGSSYRRRQRRAELGRSGAPGAAPAATRAQHARERSDGNVAGRRKVARLPAPTRWKHACGCLPTRWIDPVPAASAGERPASLLEGPATGQERSQGRSTRAWWRFGTAGPLGPGESPGTTEPNPS